MVRLAGLMLVLVTGCGNISRKSDDGGVGSDARRDGNMIVIDAMPDATPDAEVLPPAPAREITSGGIRMTGGGYTFDVQVGHATSQVKATGGTHTLEGNTGIKP